MSESFTRKELFISGLKLFGGFLPSLVVSRAHAATGEIAKKRDLLVYVFLRGGCDGLNFVTPIAGNDRKTYEQERPTLKMALEGPDALLKLDGAFGLHPSAKALLPLFQNKKLAVVHAAGLPSNTRSHFDAQNIVELGLGEKKVFGSGWLARCLEASGENTELPALSVGGLEPTSLLSFEKAVAVNDPRGLNLLGDKNAQDEQIAALAKIYQNEKSWMGPYGAQVLHTLNLLSGRNTPEYAPAPGVEYPKGEVGGRMKVLAQILKMNLGVKAATVDMGGWDTHKFQGTGSEGTFARQVEQLSESLSAFSLDMNEPGMTVVVMSEFGRRLRENANRGTDHGHGGLMFVLGDNVNGGKIYGRWPGVSTDQLYDRADLAVTTDYRNVLSEVLSKRLNFGANDIRKIFPDFKFSTGLGLVKA